MNLSYHRHFDCQRAGFSMKQFSFNFNWLAWPVPGSNRVDCTKKSRIIFPSMKPHFRMGWQIVEKGCVWGAKLDRELAP